jgi:hypothetical protein
MRRIRKLDRGEIYDATQPRNPEHQYQNLQDLRISRISRR